jgi:hypothetical protein
MSDVVRDACALYDAETGRRFHPSLPSALETLDAEREQHAKVVQQAHKHLNEYIEVVHDLTIKHEFEVADLQQRISELEVQLQDER